MQFISLNDFMILLPQTVQNFCTKSQIESAEKVTRKHEQRVKDGAEKSEFLFMYMIEINSSNAARHRRYYCNFLAGFLPA